MTRIIQRDGTINLNGFRKVQNALIIFYTDTLL